jgi:hypothetical protein
MPPCPQHTSLSEERPQCLILVADGRVSGLPHSFPILFSYVAIMVGRFQPYIYSAPVDDSSFNPKAVTIASRLPTAPPKKKQDGPYLNYNRHPDSYLILPYGNTSVKPMNKRTKTFVNVARWIQLALRVCTLLGAVGVLLCGIFIRGAADTEGYIMRIPVCAYVIGVKTLLTTIAWC